MKNKKELIRLAELTCDVAKFMPSKDEWNLFERWARTYKELIGANVDVDKREWLVDQDELHLEVTIYGPSLMGSKHKGLVSIKRGFTFRLDEHPEVGIERVQKEVASMRTRVENMAEREWQAEKEHGNLEAE